jgi:hypothetical protein
VEELSGRTAQSVNRQIARYDDGDGIKDRAVHVACRRQNHFLEVIFLSSAQTELTVNVLDHHDGAVNDDSEVDRSNREEIGGFPSEVQKNEGKEQSQRDGKSRNYRRTHAHEKENKEPTFDFVIINNEIKVILREEYSYPGEESAMGFTAKRNFYYKIEDKDGMIKKYSVLLADRKEMMHVFAEDFQTGDVLTVHFEGYTSSVDFPEEIKEIK